MPDQAPISRPPGIDEIIEASRPGADLELRKSIRERLRMAGDIQDEVVAGARDFLEDHAWDFDALNDFLHQFSETAPGNSIPLQKRRRPPMAAIWVFMLLILTSVMFFLRPDKKEIVGKLLFHEPGLPVFASMNGERDFHEMMSAFRLGDVTGGLAYYHGLSARFPASDTLSYFGGWLHFKNGDHDSAAHEFTLVSANKSSIYKQKADIMKAAALCLGGEPDISRRILDSISADAGHPYRQVAIEMKDQAALWKRSLFR